MTTARSKADSFCNIQPFSSPIVCFCTIGRLYLPEHYAYPICNVRIKYCDSFYHRLSLAIHRPVQMDKPMDNERYQRTQETVYPLPINDDELWHLPHLDVPDAFPHLFFGDYRICTDVYGHLHPIKPPLASQYPHGWLRNVYWRFDCL